MNTEGGNSRPADLRRQLVEEWQERVYNLAYRVFGRRAEASDATQEVFVQLLRKLDRYNPEQELGPWVYRVAANRIRDLMRRQKTERRHLELLAQQSQGESRSPSEIEGQRELGAAVHAEVAALQDRVRLAVVLFYYEDLSVAQVGRVLGISQTTVRTRIRDGLEALRLRLGQVGFAVIVPGGLTFDVIEDSMRSAPLVPVPAATGDALAELASGSSAARFAGFTHAIAATKSTALALAAVATASLLVGFGVGQQLGRAERGGVSSEVDEHDVAPVFVTREDVLAKLRNANEQLREDLRLARAENDRLLAQPSVAGDAAETDATAEDHPHSPSTPHEVDWESLVDALAANAEIMRLGAPSSADLTEDQENALGALMRQWAAAGAIARSRDPYAFLNEEVFRDVVSVVLEATLGLSAREIDRVTHLALVALEKDPIGPSATPLQAHAARTRAVDAVEAELGSMLSGADKETFTRMRPWIGRLLRGEQAVRLVGLKAGVSVLNETRRAFRGAYGLQRGQIGGLDQFVKDYVESYQELLTEHGQTGDARRRLTNAQRARLEQQALELSLRTEQQILPHLTDEQRDALQWRLPTFVQLRDDDFVMIATSGYAGF